MLGFKTFKSTVKTIAGIKNMHMINKGQVEGISYVNSEVQFISKIMS